MDTTLPDAEKLISSLRGLHRYLVRRWALRLTLKALSLAAFATALLLFLSSQGLKLNLSTTTLITMMLACAFLAFVFLATRTPAPTMRDAALFVEASARNHHEGGAIELVIDGNTSPLVLDQAAQTLNALDNDAVAPTLQLSGVVSLALSIGLLSLSLVLHPSSVPQNLELTTTADTSNEDLQSSSLLERMRRELLAPDAEQRAAARDAYTQLFTQQHKAINDLSTRADAGLQAALEKQNDPAALKAASEAQAQALAALENAKLDSPIETKSILAHPNAQELAEQSQRLAKEADRLEAQQQALRHALITSQSKAESVVSAAHDMTSGRNTSSASLSKAESGSIIVHHFDGKKSAQEAVAPLTPRQAQIVQRYRIALKTDKE